uniref:hypothetical protein n=1 Tax=Agathobacter sp. TaxID=2021311 RepID=UPI0040574313
MYEKEILYPFYSWWEAGKLLETEDQYLFSEFQYINPGLYTSAVELAELSLGEDSDLDNSVVTVYDFKTDATEYSEYSLRQILHVTQIQNTNDELFIVVDKNDMPVHCQYRANKNDSENNSTINRSSAMYENIPPELLAYAAQIDTVLGEESVYHSFVRSIEIQMPPTETERLPGSFAEYCKHGEWVVYSNSELKAYVCIIQNYNFILYYDELTNELCGYSIALNHLE